MIQNCRSSYFAWCILPLPLGFIVWLRNYTIDSHKNEASIYFVLYFSFAFRGTPALCYMELWNFPRDSKSINLDGTEQLQTNTKYLRSVSTRLGLSNCRSEAIHSIGRLDPESCNKGRNTNEIKQRNTQPFGSVRT